MKTIAENLLRTKSDLDSIQDAIIYMGINVSDDPRQFGHAIRQLGETYAPLDLPSLGDRNIDDNLDLFVYIFNDIMSAIVYRGVVVLPNTPTSDYAILIKQIDIGTGTPTSPILPSGILGWANDTIATLQAAASWIEYYPQYAYTDKNPYYADYLAQTPRMENIDGVMIATVIRDFNHDQRADDKGMAAFNIESNEILPNSSPMMSGTSNVNGWAGSVLRTVELPRILATMNQDLQDAITPVMTTTWRQRGNAVDIVADTLFIRSRREISGDGANNGTRVRGWLNVRNGAVQSNRVMLQGGIGAAWWVREPNLDADHSYRSININGSSGTPVSNNLLGYLIAYSIGSKEK